MEKREIMAVILAVFGICIVIALVKTVRGDAPEESSIDMPAVSNAVLTTKTDYWDYLRDQQTTTTEATQMTETTGDVTGDVTGDATGSETGTTDASGDMPAETDDTTTAVSTETTEDDGIPGFTIQASPR